MSPSEAPSSGLWSLDMPSSPRSHDSALPQSQDQQGGAASQPGHSLDPENMSVEKDGSVHAEGSGSPQQGRAAEGTDAQSNLAPGDHAEVKDLSTSTPSMDKGLALGGGPALSAFEGHPKVTDASQKTPLPKKETSGQEERVLVSVKQVGGHVLHPVSCGSDVSTLSGTCSLDRSGQGSLSVTPLWLVPIEARAKARHLDTMTQGLGGLCFFQPTDAAASRVKKAGKETRDGAQKQILSPVSPAVSKDRDQV